MIPEEEIKIDTYRKDRANVNMPDNCVRATHIPTGKFVDESESRFYWPNYHRAIKRLNELVFPEKEEEVDVNGFTESDPFISEVKKLLTSDPVADEHDVKYANEHLEGYLAELAQKDGSVLYGILLSIETYLQK